MFANPLAVMFIAIAIGTNLMTYGNPLPTVLTSEEEEAIQPTDALLIPFSDGESTVTSPSVIIDADSDNDSNEDEEVEEVPALDATMNPSFDIASTVVPLYITNYVDAYSDADGNVRADAVQAPDATIDSSETVPNGDIYSEMKENEVVMQETDEELSSSELDERQAMSDLSDDEVDEVEVEQATYAPLSPSFEGASTDASPSVTIDEKEEVQAMQATNVPAFPSWDEDLMNTTTADYAN